MNELNELNELNNVEIPKTESELVIDDKPTLIWKDYIMSSLLEYIKDNPDSSNTH